MASQFIPLEQNTRFLSDTLGPNDNLEIIIKYHGDLASIAAGLNATAERLNSNYAILTLPMQELSRLFLDSRIEYFELPRTVSYVLRDSLLQSSITPVQREAGFGLLGRGVLVAIIDSGIDFTHTDFRNSDGTSRVLYLWDQTLEGTPPAGFRSGRLFTKDELDAALLTSDPYALVPSRDIEGHGTAVAGIAAGNGRQSAGLDRGVAPEAQLIVVKLGAAGREGFPRSTDIMRGVKFATDMAEMLQMPIAINISYGTNDGAHDGNSLFEQYLDSESVRWKSVICVATGNEGTAGHHFFGEITTNQNLQVDIAIGEGVSELYITLWKNFVDTMNVQLLAPSGQSTGIITPRQSVTRATLDGVQVSVLYGQPNHYTFNQEVYFLLRSLSGTIPQSIWQLVVTGEQIVDGRFNIWLPMTDVVTRQTAFLSPNPENTITIPATAEAVISVGGYNARTDTTAEFSGRGKPYDIYGQKPDLVAPAVGIITTKINGGYDSFTGTSMAAPFVTGAAALMMEWGEVRGNDPFLYGQRIKAFLCKGAERRAELSYPNSEWGYGTLDLLQTMQYLVEYNRRGGAFQ